MGKATVAGNTRGPPAWAAKQKSRSGTSMRSSQRKDKGIATFSETHVDESAQVVDFTTAPWPKPDNTLIMGRGIPEVPHLTTGELKKATDYMSRKYGDQ